MLRDIAVFVLTRKAGSYGDGNPDGFITQSDIEPFLGVYNTENGEFIWAKSFSGVSRTFISDMTVDEYNNLIIEKKEYVFLKRLLNITEFTQAFDVTELDKASHAPFISHPEAFNLWCLDLINLT